MVVYPSVLARYHLATRTINTTDRTTAVAAPEISIGSTHGLSFVLMTCTSPSSDVTYSGVGSLVSADNSCIFSEDVDWCVDVDVVDEKVEEVVGAGHTFGNSGENFLSVGGFVISHHPPT